MNSKSGADNKCLKSHMMNAELCDKTEIGQTCPITEGGLSSPPLSKGGLENPPSVWTTRRLEEICSCIKTSITPSPSGQRIYLGLEHLASGFPNLIGKGIESDVQSGKNEFQSFITHMTTSK
jgi:hypothetical protein